MPFVLPSDVAQLQAQVRAQRDQLAAAFDACPAAKGNPVLAAQWAAESLVVDAYLGQSPSLLDTAAQMDAGQAIQRDLSQWPSRLTSAGCGNVPVVAPPDPTGLQQASSLVGHIVEGALVLGGLYLAFQLVKRR